MVVMFLVQVIGQALWCGGDKGYQLYTGCVNELLAGSCITVVCFRL